ncbi:hypothetical protein [Flavobacterium sp.]|uniref:hypothetical protein n=1 Tax=Flavobacterium sp. TaxID=239 RepID=UPI0032646DEE
MKPTLYILFLSVALNTYAQNFYLKIGGTNITETKIIDSLNYLTKHPNLKSLFEEIYNSSVKLSKKGYLDNNLLENKRINDSTYLAIINLKERTKYMHIYIGINNAFLDPSEIKNDTLKIPYEQTESYLNRIIIKAEKSGFALTKIKLENIQRKNSIIYASLNFNTEKKRNINSVIINYTNANRKDNFPKGHLKQLNKKYTNRVFNQETVKELYTDLNNYEFITQTKYPEILFTKDSTKIYTYLDKKKANTFDGYIGFTNDQNKKINLNGYLDITLINTLKAGEQFSLYWKSDGNKQTTFNAKIEIPYIFKSSLGIKAQLNIFKQDSTFQNSKTAIDLGYYINYNSKIYLGYQSTESSDIQNTNNLTISDFKNSYMTSTYEYKKPENSNLFPKKILLNCTLGYGKRNTNKSLETVDSSQQFFTILNLSYNFELNNKNFILFNSQNYFLKSNNYISNELSRFGGLNSIRGFQENSLQANHYNLLITEYRYLTTSNLYLHTILDYGIYQDKSTALNSIKIRNLLSFGIGLGLLTNNGLLKIQIANGDTQNEEIKFHNSILTICYNVKF